MGIGLELSDGQRTLLWRPIDKAVMTLGRNPECDLCVPDDVVAPVQALLQLERDELTLVNRQADGTQVGDEAVLDSLRLADGDVIHLGPMRATVRFGAHVDNGGGGTRTLVPEREPAGEGHWLTAPETHPGRRWQVTRSGLSLGTDGGNDIVLDDPYVSSFHARVSLTDGRCIVRDLDSRNGVFLGQQKVREAEIPAGAQVQIGKTRLVLVGATVPTRGNEAATQQQPLIGRSRAIDDVRELVGRIASNNAPVLVTGETGTGKEVVARLVAALSPRAAGPFIALNCGALARNIVESELFGHERGAFTGAIARKIGAFEAAHGGTLFLDEIGELPLELQPQLLRVLETGEVRRVGSAEAFRVDVRLVAATNRQLEDEVGRGAFRADLFHRLHVLAIALPPLRQRGDDVALLARHFVEVFAPPGEALELDPSALDALRGHLWPGNVRELKNVIQRACLLRRSRLLGADDITFTPSTLASRVQTTSATSSRTLYEIERDAITFELRRHGGNKKEAAAALGISRSTIHRKIEEYGIDEAALGPTV